MIFKSGPILESKGRFFRKRAKKEGKKKKKIKNAQKMAKYWKIWAKMYKIWKYFEKGQWLCAIIARNKLLEKVLQVFSTFTWLSNNSCVLKSLLTRIAAKLYITILWLQRICKWGKWLQCQGVELLTTDKTKIEFTTFTIFCYESTTLTTGHTYGTKYSRLYPFKYLSSPNFTWSILEYFVPYQPSR